MGIKTSLTKASTKGNSLRTTVPQNIVLQFELKERDYLEWVLEADKGEIIIRITPIKRKE